MKKTTTAQKSILVKPAQMYTTNEVRGFLGLAEGSYPCPSKYGMAVRKGRIQGSDVIAYLESGSCRKTRIGRRYDSGTVTVVAR